MHTGPKRTKVGPKRSVQTDKFTIRQLNSILFVADHFLNHKTPGIYRAALDDDPAFLNVVHDILPFLNIFEIQPKDIKFALPSKRDLFEEFEDLRLEQSPPSITPPITPESILLYIKEYLKSDFCLIKSSVKDKQRHSNDELLANLIKYTARNTNPFSNLSQLPNEQFVQIQKIDSALNLFKHALKNYFAKRCSVEKTKHYDATPESYDDKQKFISGKLIVHIHDPHFALAAEMYFVKFLSVLTQSGNSQLASALHNLLYVGKKSINSSTKIRHNHLGMYFSPVIMHMLGLQGSFLKSDPPAEYGIFAAILTHVAHSGYFLKPYAESKMFYEKFDCGSIIDKLDNSSFLPFNRLPGRLGSYKLKRQSSLVEDMARLSLRDSEHAEARRKFTQLNEVSLEELYSEHFKKSKSDDRQLTSSHSASLQDDDSSLSSPRSPRTVSQGNTPRTRSKTKVQVPTLSDEDMRKVTETKRRHLLSGSTSARDLRELAHSAVPPIFRRRPNSPKRNVEVKDQIVRSKEDKKSISSKSENKRKKSGKSSKKRVTPRKEKSSLS